MFLPILILWKLFVLKNARSKCVKTIRVKKSINYRTIYSKKRMFYNLNVIFSSVVVRLGLDLYN